MQAEAATRSASEEDLALEKRLVARVRTDPEAFAALYDRYMLRVYRYAYRRMQSHGDAEDVTARTFHRALEGLPQYEWRGVPFGAWLFRIAHNIVVDRLRSAAGTVSLDRMSTNGHEPVAAGDRDPQESILRQEESDTAWEAVARLPELQRRAMTLRFGRDLSHAEVGAIIGRSEAATKQLVYRAVKTLRADLGGVA